MTVLPLLFWRSRETRKLRTVDVLATLMFGSVLCTASLGHAQPYGPGGTGGRPGHGMMGGAFNRAVYPGWGGDVLDFAAVTTFLARGEPACTADSKANTVTYAGQDVTIDKVAA